MADDTAQVATEVDGEGGENAKGGKGPLFVMLAGLVVGAVSGVFVVGPMVAGGPADADSGEESSDGYGDSEYGEGGSTVYSHPVESLFTNPGADPSRILLASFAIQVDSDATVTELADRDAEVRDIMLGVLSKKTVEELIDTSRREDIKDELLQALEALHVEGTILKIHIPQWIVQ